VWDYLHSYSSQTPLNDVDVVYFDPTEISEEKEKIYEKALKKHVPYPWSVKNQARMHLRNQESRYISVADAMKRWPETATAVGMSLGQHGEFEVIAPYGLDDLFDLVIRRSRYFKDAEYFAARIRDKKWLETWPKLSVAKD